MAKVAVAVDKAGYESGKPRRLKWTCRFCERHFDTWTRRGLRVTCPHCQRVQEGPAGIQALIDAQKKGKVVTTPASVVKVVHANGVRKPPAAKPPTTQLGSLSPAAAAQPTPPAPAPKKDLLSRVLGFD